MKLYSENKYYKLYRGNMLDMLENIEPGSIDSIVTDPPYELNFMNKWWDNSGIAFNSETRKKCLDVLKPGGYLLAFGGSRTFHRIAVAIEDAGFEIRDTIMRLYGSGFPKSLNIGLAIDKKNGIDNRTGNLVEWVGSNNTLSMRNGLTESMEFKSEYEERKATNERSGRWTALKPSYEPIIVARKPFKWSCIDNVLENWVGGINIDECRVGAEEQIEKGRNGRNNKSTFQASEVNNIEREYQNNWRFPANTILTYNEEDFNEVCGGFPYTKSTGGSWIASQINTFKNVKMWVNGKNTWQHLGGLWDEWSASRYFYCAKASKRDRDEWLEEFEENLGGGMLGTQNQSLLTGSGNIRNNLRKNTHPTVKPTDLMQYLVRLVTPKWWTVLDPFNWSGSTWKAVMYENIDRNKDYKYIGIELTEEYLPIAKARIEYVINKEEKKSEEEKWERKEEALF